MNEVTSGITAILTNIFSSASKLVFLMMAATLCLGLFYGKITQDNFIYLAASVFSYYFGLSVGGQQQLKPGENPPPTPGMPETRPAVVTPPIAGVK